MKLKLNEAEFFVYLIDLLNNIYYAGLSRRLKVIVNK